MGEALNTMINGASGTCFEAADWLDQFANAAEETKKTAEEIDRSRRMSWEGPAAEAFSGSIANSDNTADRLHTLAATYAPAIRSFAQMLDSVNNSMKDALDKAVAGGLQVDGPFIIAPEKPAIEHPAFRTTQDGQPMPKPVRPDDPTYQQEWEQYYANQRDYDEKLAVYNTCKGIVEATRKTEGEAHKSLSEALKSDGDGLDLWKIGYTTASRVVGYISSFENPRKEAVAHAERLDKSATTYQRLADGKLAELDSWQVQSLRSAADKAGAGRDAYLQKAAQYEKYISSVPQRARTAAASYPGREHLSGLPDDASAGTKAAKFGLKALPYAGSILTVSNEAVGAMTGQQSWAKAGVDTSATLAGGYLGSVLTNAGAGALYGEALGPLGSAIVGTAGGIAGAVGMQSITDWLVPN